MLLPSEPADLCASHTSHTLHTPHCPHCPPPPHAPELLGLALRLRQLARTNALPQLLRGKNIGLLRAAAVVEDPGPLLRAAGELGAQVATVRWNLAGAGDPREVQHTGRMLGRLYDALVCQGMTAEAVRRIGQAAGIPVYDDIASGAHPSACLADGLGDEATPGDNRRFVLQAVLVDGLA